MNIYGTIIRNSYGEYMITRLSLHMRKHSIPGLPSPRGWPGVEATEWSTHAVDLYRSISLKHTCTLYMYNVQCVNTCVHVHTCI